jgi:2-amino-4-hydroxy-6-hydroxymethyldihydropteridine diphosphokinase
LSARTREYLISVGSNIEPGTWVPRALALLRGRFDVSAVSDTYDVPAVGGEGDPPPFENLAVRLRTNLAPRALREVCRRFEEACGRRRTADRFAPRTMDLDVVYGGPDVPADDQLPHPDLLAYPFVLVPCAEVWPDAVHPGEGRSLAELAADRHPDWAAAHRRGGS